MRRLFALFVGSVLLAPCYLCTHCQLPCGIYHDDLRFASLEEDVQTLSKAIVEIKANGGGSPLENNQLVRSVNLKDEYSDKIAQTITFYFLQQRLTPNQENLDPLLRSAFNILVLARKVKASVDPNLISQLQEQITQFKKLYKQT